jgi:hypothetical protein
MFTATSNLEDDATKFSGCFTSLSLEVLQGPTFDTKDRGSGSLPLHEVTVLY